MADAVDLSMSTRTGKISVAVDPVALVVTECITVTSAMRKHARWAHSSVAAILGGSGAMASTRLDDPAKKRTSRLQVGGPTTDKARQIAAADASKQSSTSASLLADDIGLAGRWGLRGKKGQSMQDNPLLSAFARLRSDLKGVKDIHTIDAPAILHPFLQVIRSSSTSAPITSLALIAITKFLAYNIISKESPQLPLAMQRLSSAVTNCRFEASDSATDEIVLFRILKLMEGMITGPTGDVIGDESMCEMMETCISMCCQVRLSELLRRSAEVSMISMCQTIFERLKHLEVEIEVKNPLGRKTSARTEPEIVSMDPSIEGDMLSSAQTSAQTPQNEGSSLELEREKPDATSTETADESSQVEVMKSPVDEGSLIKPYSLPSIRELFRVLVDLLDPHERQHNDTMRVMALRIVDVALEVAGPSIASHPSLATLAKDTLCRHLFQLVRSENIVILNESLRVAGTLLSTCRRVLKLQQELFLSYLVGCLHPRVEIPLEPGIDPSLYDGVPQAPRLAKPVPSQSSSGRSTPVPVKDRQRLGMEGGLRKPDAREAMVESVGALVRIPQFMAELFVNYDCEIDRSDLCLDMVGLLARNAFPDAATWSTTNVPPLCLDALLGYVQSLADRLDDEPEHSDYPDRSRLKSQRDLKKIIIKGADKFNENPRAGISFLASQQLIDNPDDPNSIAQFLKGTTRIDKKVLGDYISKRSNEHLLHAFMNLFDFSDLRVDEALRQLLNSFRLPGEAPLIERIVNEFSEKYYTDAAPANIVDKDAIFVLTYAIIMLNTDQHNPNVKTQNRMLFSDFAKNLRGVNGGKDFEQEYLEEIYESIKTQEIVLPEEHDNKHSFDHAWKELLYKLQSTEDLVLCNTNVFDADMFAATWKPVVATLSYVFMSATDDTVFARVVAGFDQCAQIAAKYGLCDALDQIIFCLSSISSLASADPPDTQLNTEVQAGEKSVMVSKTAVAFGRDFKAQLATVVLFRLVKGNERAIRTGWNQLLLIILNLFLNSLISKSYYTTVSASDLSPIPLQMPVQVIDRKDPGSEGGLFSAFTSYVSSFANGEPLEPSDQEIEQTLCTVDCINACSFDQLFKNISELPLPALTAFVKSLMARLPEDSSPQIMLVKPEIPAPTPIRVNVQKPRESTGTAYDPSIVFVLEFATILAARDKDTIAALGKEVSATLQNVVRNGSSLHSITLSRAIFYLLSFLRASHDHDFLRAPVILHSLSKLPAAQLHASAKSIMKGINLCLSGPNGLRNEILMSPDLWSVLHSLHSSPDTAPQVFEVVLSVAEGPPSALTPDNYERVVDCLSDFGNAGSIASQDEKRREKEEGAQQRGRGQKEKSQRKPNETILRGVKAMQVVLQITSRVPSFIQQSQLEAYEAWKTYWTPPLRTLKHHAVNPCRPIRSQALKGLSRVMLSPHLITPPPIATDGDKDTDENDVSAEQIIPLFTNVLFPLLTQLLKPEVWHSDPTGMGETRLSAAVLTMKVYLRFLDILLDPAAFNARSIEQAEEVTTPQLEPSSPKLAKKEEQIDGITLWSHILTLMERLLKSGSSAATTAAGAGSAKGRAGAGTPQNSSRSGTPNGRSMEPDSSLEEAIPESVKNILLVMGSSGYLAAPPAPASAPAPVPEQQPQQRGEGEGGEAETTVPSADGEEAAVPKVDTVAARASVDGDEPEESRKQKALQARLWHVSRDGLKRFLPDLLTSEVLPVPQTQS